MSRGAYGLRAGGERNLVLLAAALFFTWRAAHAEPASGEKVTLSIECEPIFATELRRIVRLELGGLLHEGPWSDAGPQGQLEVRCERELARVSARDARRVQQANNDLRFDAFPGDAAPRAVALAAVEALRAVDPTLSARIQAQRTAAAADVRTAPPAAAPPVEPIPARPAVRDRREAARAWSRISLGPVVRQFVFQPATTAWGARVELSRHSSVPIDYGFEVEGALVERSVELGTIDMRLVSAAAWTGLRAGRADWSFTAGAGGRFGIVQLQGSSPAPAVEARQTSRFWAGPFAVARVDAAFGALALALAVEAGWAVAGAEGLSQGAPVVGARGAWLSLSLNPGIRF